MKSDLTKKIAYSAICTAISAVVVLITAFSPAKIVPLIFVSLCVYIAFKRCGIVYGILTAIATALISFALSGIQLSFVALVSLFIPYAIIAYAMQKLSYDKLLHAIIRLLITATLYAVAFIVIINLVDIIAGTTVMALVEKLGSVFVVIAMVVIALPVDFFFSYMSEKIIKLLK